MAHQAVTATRKQPGKRWAACLLLVLTSAVAGTLTAYAAEEGAAGTDAPAPVKRAHPNMRMRDPAAVLAQRLELNSKQTAEVRRLLVNNRTKMRAVWNDAAIAPDDRVGAVKAINEKTQSQIRALLTEEQKKKYFQPRPDGSPANNNPQPSVAEWLNVNRPSQQVSSEATAPDPAPR
jgi:hypothetical protein